MKNLGKKRLSAGQISMFLLLLLLLGAAVLLGRQVYLLTPTQSINGLYQSAAPRPVYYSAQFYGTNFYLRRTEDSQETTLLEGTFQRLEKGENLYLLRDEDSGAVRLITLGHKEFCYYDSVLECLARLRLIAPTASYD